MKKLIRNIIIFLYEKYCVDDILEQQRLSFIQEHGLQDCTDEEIEEYITDTQEERNRKIYDAGKEAMAQEFYYKYGNIE